MPGDDAEHFPSACYGRICTTYTIDGTGEKLGICTIMLWHVTVNDFWCEEHETTECHCVEAEIEDYA